MALMKSPKSVDINITDNCNLRCKYCSHFTSDSNVGRDLPLEEWLKFFEELGRLAVMDICLCGGEPFYRQDIKEIIKGIVKNRMRFSVLSNGTLITDELAEFIASTGRCSSVQVSIDGSEAAVHDASRGQGTFVKAVEAIKKLQKNKISATVRVTINRHNVRNLEAVSKMLLEDLGLPGFSTNSASYMGLCRQNDDEISLTTEERAIAMEELLKLVKKYNGRIGAAAGPLAEAKFWLKMMKAKREGAPPLSGGGMLTSCGGPNSKIAVLADGTIVSCLQLPNMKLGTINKDSLQEIWINSPELNRFRKRREIPIKGLKFCEGCEYIPYCRGGCPALAHTTLGDAYGPSADSCLRKFLKEGGRLPDEKLLMEEKEGCGCNE
ncbi:MAG: SynChlorMet cassette radical SAM/SPASM protein ScmE [Candidatus Saganbacteria bacterium]|nr:SynChlorMet cassette radical SAM/SPASM protein ScmE [Candidatus Saganbacteria bacterium]